MQKLKSIPFRKLSKGQTYIVSIEYYDDDRTIMYSATTEEVIKILKNL